MKTLIIKLTLFAAVVLMTGCGFHSGYMTNSASLSSANFSYAKMNAKGTSEIEYIFGFGGLAKTNLVNAAKQNLLSENPLKDNQALANITVNFRKETYFLIYSKVTCIVAGDIVMFNK